MRFFHKFSLILAVIITATSIILPHRYEMAFPRDPGPELDRYARTDSAAYIDESHPQIVLLGDSTLLLGVDEKGLAEQTGKSVYGMGKLGAASAMWYLLLKNNVVEASYKPEYVVVIFRNSILTAPGFRVQGNYLNRLDEYARKNEPLLIQKSFVKLMNPLEITAEKYFPLYVLRNRIRESAEKKIRYLGAALVGCDQACTDDALEHTFAVADFEPQALVDALNSADDYFYTNDQLDFDARVNDSYLPEMIRLAHENGIKIVFVHIKVEDDPDLPALDTYLNSLYSYLEDNNAYLLDFSHDGRLTHDLFLDSIHLNPKGQVVFTQMVADGLNSLFAEK